MWGFLVIGSFFVLLFSFSLAKVSSRAERITEKHRGELLERKDKSEL